MASANKVILIGNLTRDPEVRYTPKGSAVAEFALAINRKYKSDSGESREEVTYIDCTAWGKTAELAGQYLSKGKPLYVEGRLQQESWEDKQTGQKRSKVKVVIENMQFLGAPSGDGGERRSGGSSRPPSRASQSQPRHEEDPSGGLEDDDIPF